MLKNFVQKATAPKALCSVGFIFNHLQTKELKKIGFLNVND